VFASPTGAFMGMTVFKNGSLARERIKNECGLDWRGFSAALRTTPAGNGGAMMIPWFEPEITPLVLNPRVHEAGLPAENGPARVRAVIEGQMMSMALHSRWMGVVPAEIRATGGASSNVEILQIAADVFGAPVQRLRVPNSAALGAALRAWHADALADGRAVPWDEIVAGFTDAAAESRVAPIPAHVATYREMIDRYQRWEHQALRPEKGSEGEKGSG
jgi:xylulokinase